MDVSLTPELQRFISMKIDSGTYSSASEVVQEALKEMLSREESRQPELEATRSHVQAGLADLTEGRFVEGTGQDLYLRTIRAARSRHNLPIDV